MYSTIAQKVAGLRTSARRGAGFGISLGLGRSVGLSVGRSMAAQMDSPASTWSGMVTLLGAIASNQTGQDAPIWGTLQIDCVTNADYCQSSMDK